MRYLLVPALILAPLAAGAVGSDDPKPDDTAEQCAEGLVFDIATQTCLPPEQSTNEDSAMLDAIEDLAYEGRYAEARGLIDLLDDPQDDRALAYLGFTTRKMGDVEAGLAVYAKALSINPDNLLVRSYKGMAHVEAGEMTLAMAELTEIRMRGGRGGWPETSLAEAISTGRTSGY